MTVWHVEAEWDNIELLMKIRELAKENLATNQMTTCHVAAKKGNLEILQKI
jgi:hypothetical protein